jgi:hypothetical protein
LSSQPIRIGFWIDLATSSAPERVLGTAGQTGRVDQTMIKAADVIDIYKMSSKLVEVLNPKAEVIAETVKKHKLMAELQVVL